MAERTLGRMIWLAREAGDLADEGRPGDGETMQTLHSLGIEPHLAAYAVKLARLMSAASTFPGVFAQVRRLEPLLLAAAARGYDANAPTGNADVGERDGG